MSRKEVDNEEGTYIDMCMIALGEINKEGNGGAKENDEIKKSFMG